VFGRFFKGAQAGFYDIPVGEELWTLFLVNALNKIRAKGAFHLATKRDSRVTKGGDAIDQHHELGDEGGQIALKVLELTIDESLASMPEHYRQMLTLPACKRFVSRSIVNAVTPANRPTRLSTSSVITFQPQIGRRLLEASIEQLARTPMKTATHTPSFRALVTVFLVSNWSVN